MPRRTLGASSRLGPPPDTRARYVLDRVAISRTDRTTGDKRVPVSQRPIVSATSTASRPSRFAVAARALTCRPRSAEWQLWGTGRSRARDSRARSEVRRPAGPDPICARICARDAAGRVETGETGETGETATLDVDPRYTSAEVRTATGDQTRRQRRMSYGTGARCHDGSMPEPVSLRLITTSEQRQITERLWQLYLHDLSEFWGSIPGSDGLYKTVRLLTYFEDPDRCGYLTYSDQALAGFALIHGVAGELKVMGDFFVVRAARRQRIGHKAAVRVMSLHPGRWAIPFQEENPGAARFWRRVGAEVAAAGCEEERRPVPGKPAIPLDTWLLLSAKA